MNTVAFRETREFSDTYVEHVIMCPSHISEDQDRLEEYLLKQVNRQNGFKLWGYVCLLGLSPYQKLTSDEYADETLDWGDLNSEPGSTGMDYH